jgi:hypothetical protein
MATTISECLTPIVHQCIMNQIRGYWLLSNAEVAMTKIMHMQKECATRNAFQPPLQCGTFEQKMTMLYCHMATKVLKVLQPFLSIVTTFS